jgi:hypothetical protein
MYLISLRLSAVIREGVKAVGVRVREWKGAWWVYIDH